ncbi:hypothetical protein G6F56_008045 [Rhizopus delemar]|nr:hypothetical protein G6F56_008045 [Rhizopus delemar]
MENISNNQILDLILILLFIVVRTAPRNALPPSNNPLFQQVLTSANVRPVSNLQNPNAYGRRDIKKTMEDVQRQHAEKGLKYKVPSPKTRIIGLLKRLMEDADEVATDRDIDEQYSNLREKTRAVFEDMVRAQEAAMNDMGSTRRLHSWSLKWGDNDKAIRLQHALNLEQAAKKIGLNIHRCVDSWGAFLILSDVCRDAETHPPKHAHYYPVANLSRLAQSSNNERVKDNSDSDSDDSIEAEFVARARAIARSHNDDSMNDIISSANSSSSGVPDTSRLAKTK